MGFRVVSSRTMKRLSLEFRIVGFEHARLWERAYTIIERFWSIRSRRLSLVRKEWKCWRAFPYTFTLLSYISLQKPSTNYINFDYWACFTVIECTCIHFVRLSTACNLTLQSVVFIVLINYLNSSINCGSTGFETDGYLFLNVLPVIPAAMKVFVVSENCEMLVKPSEPAA